MVLADDCCGCRSTCRMAAHPWVIDHPEGDKRSIMTLRMATLAIELNVLRQKPGHKHNVAVYHR